MLKGCGVAGMGLATGTTSWDELLAQPGRPPIGLALCIGLNFIDPQVYGTSGRLTGCVPDADAMRRLLGPSFLTRTLYDLPEVNRRRLAEDRVASRQWVRRWIDRAALGPKFDGQGGLRQGDIFVITYAGHGSDGRRDTNRDEAQGKPPDDGHDETWCLYDGEMIDDERAELFSRFQPGVRIVSISDSCFSGSHARALEDRDLIIREVERELAVRDPGAREAAVSDMEQRFTALEDSLRGAPRGVEAESIPLPVRQLPPAAKEHLANSPEYVDMMAEVEAEISAPRAASLDVSAHVIAIGSCSDSQTAADMGTNGLFTSRLLQVWNAGTSLQNYHTFFSALAASMPSRQTPQIDQFGKSPSFAGQKPFSVA
jgi:hypothetical protein